MLAAVSLSSSAAGKYYRVSKSTATKLTEAPASSKVNQADQGMMASKLNQAAQGMGDMNSVNPIHIN